MRNTWIALALALAACGSKKQADKTENTDKPVAGKAAEAAPKPAADFFTGKTVTKPEPIAKLKFGMPEADAKTAAPDVFAAKYGYEVPGYETMKINVQIEDGKVYQERIEIKQPIETVKGWLTTKWGEPRATKNSIGNPEYIWDAPDVGLSAKLETSASNSMLRFNPVMSFEQALGSDPNAIAPEKLPKIGATEDEVKAAFAAYNPRPRDNDPGSIYMSTPTIAGGEWFIGYSVRVKDGKVTGYTLSVPSTFTDKLAPKLEGTFGKGKLDGQKLYTDFKGPVKAKAELRNDAGFSTTVWVGDYKK